MVKSVTIKTKFATSRILRKHVGEVRNLYTDEVDGEGNAKKLVSGSDIAESTAFGIGRIIDMICAEVTSDIITASEKKSS